MTIKKTKQESKLQNRIKIEGTKKARLNSRALKVDVDCYLALFLQINLINRKTNIICSHFFHWVLGFLFNEIRRQIAW